jgi:small subunit ribosomal protein S16
LSRWGVARNPFYGIVATNARSPRDAKYLERLGTYNPIPDENGVKQVQLNFERSKWWLANGAETSPRVEHLFIKVTPVHFTLSQS